MGAILSFVFYDFILAKMYPVQIEAVQKEDITK